MDLKECAAIPPLHINAKDLRKYNTVFCTQKTISTNARKMSGKI